MIDFNSTDPLVQLNFTTTPIGIYKNDIKDSNASGFFFKHNEKRYLVTNRHVVIDEDDNFYPDKLVIELHTQNKVLKDFDEFEIELYNNGKQNWLQHPDYNKNNCDVVMIELPKKIEEAYFIKCFRPNNFLNDRIFETIPDVLVLGYPLGFFDEKNCMPVYRKGTVASAFGHHFDDQPYFLIDANLHEGTSGSPVISSAHNTLKNKSGSFVTSSAILLGIHSAEHYTENEPLGLNVVWYGELLLEILK
ncbi:hypothetical protein MASR2M47_29880 [Draconibacterium sp.]